MKDNNSIYRWQQKQHKSVSSFVRESTESEIGIHGTYIELEILLDSNSNKQIDYCSYQTSSYRSLYYIFACPEIDEIMSDEIDDDILDYIENGLNNSKPNEFCFTHYRNKIGIFFSKKKNIHIPSFNRRIITFYFKEKRPLKILIKKIKKIKASIKDTRLYPDVNRVGNFPDYEGNIFFVRSLMWEMFGWE
jgi:hypothetical protein